MVPSDLKTILDFVYLHYGITGILVAWIVYSDIYLPWKKKANGAWVSYSKIEAKLKELDERVGAHDKRDSESFMAVNLAKAIQDEKNLHFTEMMAHLEKGQDNIYSLISEIKSILMQR